MKQNIYDNPDFFAGYAALRRTERGLNAALEWPALRSILPELGGKRVLDLGCGFGPFCRYAAEHGAESVVGVDISERMLAWARRENPGPRIRYLHAPIEEARFEPASFDLVASSLAMHYVERFDQVCPNVARWLDANGAFLFSVEHPICTASTSTDLWCRDESGARRHWIVDNYQHEGIRHHRWFVEDVIKYHRKTETYVNTLVDCGFAIGRMLEPPPTAQAMRERPELIDDFRRPPFLLMAARKR
jgi:SAM-dependent methyltransferase